ncbi:hypothetical protein F5Y05DRAFT_345710 [Hypoxylon sp. FL0543]|nr:hypothetical protein F5Y05DRAFT_345710 [Hypoxylon sp. FL0543]
MEQDDYTDSVYEDTASWASSQALPEEDTEEQPVNDAGASRQSAHWRSLPEPPSRSIQPQGGPQSRAMSRIPRPSASASSLRQVPRPGEEPVPRSNLAATPAPPSSKSVRFLLPEGHQDSFDGDDNDDDDNDTEEISPMSGSDYPQDVSLNTVNEDTEEYKLEDLEGPSSTKARSYEVNSGHVNTQHIADSYHIADQHDADRQHRGDNHQQPQPLPLSLRLGQEPPYPPPGYPPPPPPFPPRKSSMQGIPRALTHAKLISKQGKQRTLILPNKSSPPLGRDSANPSTRETRPPETAQAGLSIPAGPLPPSTTRSETVFPSFGSSPTESSAGPRRPLYTHSNATHRSVHASVVDESEMPSVRPNSTGSPIYIGVPTGLLTDRNASQAGSTPTQGPPSK